MKSVGSISLGTVVVCLGLVSVIAGQQPAPKSVPVTGAAAAAPKQTPAVSHPQKSESAVTQRAKADEQNALVKRYCAGCHSDRAKAGNLSLSSFDITKAGPQAEVAERMIRKLQASMMPPPGMPRPEPAVYQAFIHSLETTVDAYAKANPNPGSRTFPRLNRAEYASAIKDLLLIDVDSASWLPQDTMSANFDNIADEQALRRCCSRRISTPPAKSAAWRWATRTRRRSMAYTNQTYVSQHPWDLPRARPARAAAWSSITSSRRRPACPKSLTNGDNSRSKIDISIDGQRVSLLQYENGPDRR